MSAGSTRSKWSSETGPETLFGGKDASLFGRRQRRARGPRLPVIAVTGFLGSGKTTLIRALLARRIAQTDPLGIGLYIDENYALIDPLSQRSKRVRAIGPLARAAFWECIAIPDIRLQCRDLSEKIAATASANLRVGHEPALNL